MNFQHRDLASGRWFDFTLVEQMANIGSEVSRAINWRKKGRSEYSNSAFERALELIDLTLADARLVEKRRLKEIARLREVLVDYLAGSNEYQSTDESLEKYFYAFNYAARARRA